MVDELKSAWEIALEKMNQDETTQVRKLTDTQRAEIAEIRSRFKARIAEAEISSQGAIAGAVAEGDASKLESLRQQLVDDKARLNRDMEREVERVRNRD